MTWMTKWSGGFPLYLDGAQGNRVTDIDGHTYVDFALGDTGAMAGHSPAPTVARRWPSGSATAAASRRCCPPRTPPGSAPS